MESEFYLISGLFKDSQVWPPTFSPITGVWCCFQLHRCCFLLLQGVGCAPDVCRLFCRESRCCSQVYRECGVRLLLCAILCCVPFYCVCCVWLLGSGLYSSNFFCCFVV
ncbi:uncharacterized protein [Spinacia oleracea]|uniref:Uncharacterized protein isoform X2 n=1 Tax=Spinacia oleracea TaxID=3562 RepID=A0ABM3QHC2_SPIOL|nr:uncharacterized protein LOC110780046 isoform X5 [Spinacia oleracea]XP_056682754.1 uncharacterized protein LOC110780046 isoform X5 [Spinacia oleracea]XP_056684363.1 uncharacterized protein LOC130459092 isoform X2 [Spinacia oleracea]XP_056684364.1 uncharacterized protein LOC130459092 isoform X2 [Spinacia oleracea]